ncbi:MAG: hypothetical protein XD63_1183 [Thermoanaerobacterales bacterium 50_218]|nr:MAG: hypothetical protein XD63_1183 [Thermoanaerobacterales bacterium 50_218]
MTERSNHRGAAQRAGEGGSRLVLVVKGALELQEEPLRSAQFSG